MPAPARTSSRHGGFTLIELLIVLVLVGITAGLAILAVGDGGTGRRAEDEARRIAALADLASQQAVLTGRPWGLQIRARTYRFLTFEAGAWHHVESDTVFAARTLPDGIGARVLRRTADAAPDRPDTVFFPDGTMLAAVVELAPEQGRQRYAIDFDESGLVRIEAPRG
ncbi:MAG: type II secretion system minor pseudopilin GspH [Gammaproteobacteria bacterium]